MATPGKNWADGVWAPGVWRPGVWAAGAGGVDPPVFSGSIANQELTVNAAMTPLDSSVRFSNSPTSYSLAGTLPTGLSFATDTGILSGTPTQIGTFASLQITATNADGSAQSNLFTVYVADTAEYASGAGRKRDARRRGFLRCGFGRG